MKNMNIAFSMAALAGLLFADTAAFADSNDVKAIVISGKTPFIDIASWHSVCLQDKQQVVYAATAGIGLKDAMSVTGEQLAALENAFVEKVDSQLIEPINQVAATLVLPDTPDQSRVPTAEEQALNRAFTSSVKNFKEKAGSVLGDNMQGWTERLEFYPAGKNLECK
jgi:hypothetical protein